MSVRSGKCWATVCAWLRRSSDWVQASKPLAAGWPPCCHQRCIRCCAGMLLSRESAMRSSVATWVGGDSAAQVCRV